MIEEEVNLLDELNSISKIHFLNRGDIDDIMTEFAKVILPNLKMERMNVWLFNSNKTALVSIGEYDTRTDSFSKNTSLYAKDFPIYFNALNLNEIIIAEDIYSHPLTKEFSESYSKPNNIYSLLDIPLRIAGELVGVICYEKTEKQKEFSKAEIHFCLSVSFVLASNLESRKLRVSQQKLEKVLQEKELLLKEINHRVKNNLSILISLMRLTKSRIKSDEAKNLMEEYEQRIFSMLKIHDMLDKSNQYSEISLSDYIKELIVEFRVSYPQINHNFKTDIEYSTFAINTKKAIHLGLIISEILLNSIKYAAAKSTNFEMLLSLKQTENNSFRLKIGDNGTGFNFKEINLHDTLGLDLIKDLADSLEMNATYPSNNNAYYTFDLKI